MASPDRPCALCAAPSGDAVPTAAEPYTVCGACGLVRRTGPESSRRDEIEDLSWARASAALRLGRLTPDMRVLVVEGGPGLCGALNDIIGVSATDYPPGDAELASFDCVLVYERLERVGDPLGLLERALRWLRPGGRVIVETHNLAHPVGPLSEGLLDGQRAHVFDEITLRALLGRAGIDVQRVDAEERMLASGVFYPGPVRATPVVRRGRRVAACLDGYRHLERLRREILVSGCPAAYVGGVASVLQRPTFEPHTTRVMRELEHVLSRVGAYRVALALCEAVLEGDTSSRLRQHCRRSSFIYRAKLGMSEPLAAVVTTAA